METYLPNSIAYSGHLTQQLLPNSRKQCQRRPVRLRNTHNQHSNAGKTDKHKGAAKLQPLTQHGNHCKREGNLFYSSESLSIHGHFND